MASKLPIDTKVNIDEKEYRHSAHSNKVWHNSFPFTPYPNHVPPNQKFLTSMNIKINNTAPAAAQGSTFNQHPAKRIGKPITIPAV